MSNSSVTLTVRPDRVALLLVDQASSRANILTKPLWEELSEALSQLAHDQTIQGLMIASGKPGMFIAGADLKFLGSLPQPNDPSVRELMHLGLRVLAQFEALPFPTLAAIDGPALGGGFEVALACDYRCFGSNPINRLGLPEVNLGLIPGWGGTQRLPRLVGVELASQMITQGQSFSPTEWLQLRQALIERSAPSESLLDIAASFLLEQTEWRDWRNARTGILHESEPLSPLPDSGSTAAKAAWHCIEAARNRTLEAGLQVETEEFVNLAGTEESRQLIQQFFSSRKK
jgi:enoyl-CoA hydratase